MSNISDTRIFESSKLSLRRTRKQKASANYATAKLAELCEVMLLIRGLPERIQLSESQQCTLGRFEGTAEAEQYVDLTAYGADTRGVSRNHASLQLIDDRICIVDHGSTNGTYVGGERITPHQPLALRKGQEFHLGQLSIQLLVI